MRSQAVFDLSRIYADLYDHQWDRLVCGVLRLLVVPIPHPEKLIGLDDGSQSGHGLFATPCAAIDCGGAWVGAPRMWRGRRRLDCGKDGKEAAIRGLALCTHKKSNLYGQIAQVVALPVLGNIARRDVPVDVVGYERQMKADGAEQCQHV
jgi:hypothetical protein